MTTNWLEEVADILVMKPVVGKIKYFSTYTVGPCPVPIQNYLLKPQILLDT